LFRATILGTGKYGRYSEVFAIQGIGQSKKYYFELKNYVCGMEEKPFCGTEKPNLILILTSYQKLFLKNEAKLNKIGRCRQAFFHF
jgi:hypothetical protein